MTVLQFRRPKSSTTAPESRLSTEGSSTALAVEWAYNTPLVFAPASEPNSCPFCYSEMAVIRRSDGIYDFCCAHCGPISRD